MLFIRLFMYVGSPSSSLVSRWAASAAWNASKSCIHSTAKSWGCTSVLLKTRMNGSLVLYRILDAPMFHRSPSYAEANKLLPASVEHIGHESCRSHRSGGINDIGYNSGKAGSHGIGYDGSRCRPGKNLDLPRSVQNHVTGGSRLAVMREMLQVGSKYSTVSALFSTRSSTWSNLVVNRLSAVRMPPFGPRLYLFQRCFEARWKNKGGTYCLMTSW